MKHHSLFTTAAALLLAGACMGAFGQADAPAFTTAWRQAASTAGGEALADLTAWPFLYEGKPLQRSAFIQRAVPGLFTPAVRRCLQKAPPQTEGGRLVFSCKPYLFYAGPVGAGAQRSWRLQEFAVDVD